jgi:uncharacterized membrane protein YhhN
VPLSLAALLLALLVTTLLVAIRRGARRVEAASKTAASLLLLLLAVARCSPGDRFATLMVVGLALCAVGDVLLLRERGLDAGLLAFLAGHLAYLAAFQSTLPVAGWSPLPLLPLSALGFGALAWLWPYLGRRRVPVVLYVVTITAMAWGASATALAGAVRWTAAPGAVLFELSDLAVARHRFVRPAFWHRAVGLPAYYLGQLLLVLSL